MSASGFPKAKNENIPTFSGKKILRSICFALLEPFDQNEQQLMQAMKVSDSGQLDFDESVLRGEKIFQQGVM